MKAWLAIGICMSCVPAWAEFRGGRPGKPAVPLMHGFPQTHEYSLILALAELEAV